MTFDSIRSVPFKIDDINHGFQEAKGLLKIRNDGVELEFEVTDALIGIFKSGIRNLFFPFDSVKEITYEKGWFGAKIRLEATSMKVFEDLPGTEYATCTLKVKRSDRKQAQSVISQVRMKFSEHRLSAMDRDDQSD